MSMICRVGRQALVPMLAGLMLAGCGGELEPLAASPRPEQEQQTQALKRRASVPGTPREVRAVAGDAQATVSWLAPWRDGGRTLREYVLRCQPSCAPLRVPASLLQATVGGLANGTAYTFTVAAVNDIGEGPASMPSAPVTPQATTPPPTEPPPTEPPPTEPVPTPTKWVSGYYVGYQRHLYPVEAVDFSTLTHLIVGRVTPNVDGTLNTHFDIDNTQGPAMARALATRAHQAGRKALLMVGGAGEHARFVGAASPENRAFFVRNLLGTLDSLGYDGLDIDWEPILTEDWPHLLALLRELRAARPGMLLTIPVGWVNANFPDHFDSYYAELAAVVDQMNLMSYGMAGNWGGWNSWHSSALLDHAPTHPTSIDVSVQRFLAIGVPAHVLGIGMGFYGSCWVGLSAPRVPLAGLTVSTRNSDNAMSYTHIMRDYYLDSARRWDDGAKVPYLSFSSPRGPQGCNFVSYEDAQSIAEKGRYVHERGLGGTIIWTINQGHLPWAPEGSRDPLLQATRQAFLQ